MSSILNKAEAHVRQLLEEGLTADHQYHNLAHTLAVVEASGQIASQHDLEEDAVEVLVLAAWFHDAGFVNVFEGHEEAGTKLASEFLKEQQYPPEKIDQVNQLILATRRVTTPQNILEQIIRDADLSNLGRVNYMSIIPGLRHEWEFFRNEKYNDKAWFRLNAKFLEEHQYFTEGAKKLFAAQCQANLETLKKISKKKKGKKKKAKEDTRTGATIGTNRSAQMMFKTALRNHMDLSNLADNKANIMLSVNALIVTIAVPMAAGYINDSPHLMMPLIVLLLTCLISMIFATLATRPIPMTGITTPEDIAGGKSNLFFFGNFYKMGLKEYDDGMDAIIKSDENLEAAIKRDLYFLGRSLGNKYNQLRICYNLFMIGVVLSVIMFGLSYAIFE